MVYLLRLGEETAQLGTMALRAAEIHEEQSRLGIQRLVSLMVPVLIIIIGGAVAGIVSSLMPAAMAHALTRSGGLKNKGKKMTEELVFYTNPMSRGRIVRWMLEEVWAALPDRIAHVGTGDEGAGLSGDQSDGQGALRSPMAAAWSRRSRRSAPIWRTPSRKPAWRPPPTQRADYYRWMFFSAGPLENAITNKSMGFAVPAEREAMAGYGNFTKAMDVLEICRDARPLRCGRAVQHRRCTGRFAYRLRAHVRLDREAAGLRRLSCAPGRTPGGGSGPGEIDDALIPKQPSAA